MKCSTNHTRALLLFSLLLTQLLWGQQIQVLDQDTQEPLGNVFVFNADRSKTALSDFDGMCNLDTFGRNERITFSHLGYDSKRTTKQVIVRNNGKVFLSVNPEQLEEVVMSISKWEQQKKDIPQKIVSVKARDIAFTSPQTSADLLQNSGQVFVQKSQLGGGSPMIRGFATNRLLLSVDGVRMNNAIFRGGNIQNVISIDPFTVKNTEVIFGPGSVIYGSDAIGGVMNFLTKEPQVSSKGNTADGNAFYRFSSANRENTIHADVSIGKSQWAFLTSLTYNNFSDLYMGRHGPDSYLRNNFVTRQNGEDVLTTNSEPRRQVPTAYDQISFLQKVVFKPANRWAYDVGFYFTQTSDYPRYDRLIQPDSSGEGLRSAEWFYGPQKWFMGKLQATQFGRGKFYDRVRITTAYQLFEESRNERNFQQPLRYTTEEKVDAFSANLDFENKRMGDLRLYYGAEYILNAIGSEGSETNIENDQTVPGPSRYPDSSTWQTAAAYMNAEYSARPNFTLLTGMRYSHVWINAPFDTTFFPFPFDRAKLNSGALTGSLGFSWFPSASLQFTLNGSTGFRAPNIDDIGKVFDSEPGSVVVPNPQLEPEYAYNLEIGLRKNFDDKLVLRGAAYYTYLVDALVRRDFLFNGQNQIIYNGELSNVQAIQNAANAYVYGFELGLEAFLTEEISLLSNVTFTEGREEDDNGMESALRHAPPTFGDLHLRWKNERLQTDLFLNFNGEISFADLALSERSKPFIYDTDENGNPFSPSWYTLNFRSQYALSDAVNINLNLENITDQRYRPYSSGIAAPGINLVLGLGVRF